MPTNKPLITFENIRGQARSPTRLARASSDLVKQDVVGMDDDLLRNDAAARPGQRQTGEN
ncbi:MAG: hypothetical protein HC809_03590 [Gammaproteobacteria bacterium]|nr:hypothetical protein [Gammaproteobacteria bacterium]